MSNDDATRAVPQEGVCLDPDVCDWLYDGGDASVGVNAAWVCQACGMVDVNREPPSDPEYDY